MHHVLLNLLYIAIMYVNMTSTTTAIKWVVIPCRVAEAWDRVISCICDSVSVLGLQVSIILGIDNRR